MAKNIKRITFGSNYAGYQYIDVDMSQWVITGGCVRSIDLINKNFRLGQRGTRVEYHNGISYSRLPVVIESIK